MAVLEMHPLNQGFSWTATSPPYRRITSEQATSFDEQGYFVVEDAFDGDGLARILAEIDPMEEQFEGWLRQQAGQRAAIARADEITFTTHLVARSPVLRDAVGQAPLVDLCADLVGPDARLYWDQAVYKKPDTAASFPWHQDNGYAFVEPQQYLTCWIALTDATEQNGCPWVVPGVHRRGTLRHWPTATGLVCMEASDEAVPVPARAGSIVVFSSLTPHCTGPNRTETVRKSYIVQYAPDDACVVARNERGEVLRTPASAAERQFSVLVGGRVVSEHEVDDVAGGG